MYLTRLKAQNFRNFHAFDLEPCGDFNLIYGANGSGKTSILEAIHFLSLGRSFRSHLVNRIIQYEAEALTVFGAICSPDEMHFNIGIEKDRTGKLRLKVGNEIAHSAAQLAKVLPLQLLNPDSYNLLNEGPKLRREFLDWGVFHVEPLFFSIWQRFQKSLTQRNAALQRNLPLSQIQAWDNELIPAAIELANLREKYFQQLVPLITEIFSQLILVDDMTVSYQQGWDKNEHLSTILSNAYFRDRTLGYTQYGPQRADVIFKINKIPAHDVLSRGEQKLLVCALKLAQGILLKQLTGKTCLYLLDDLAAELDSNHREQVIKVLSTLKAQVFITAVDVISIGNLLQELSHKTFHVEHNAVRFVST